LLGTLIAAAPPEAHKRGFRYMTARVNKMTLFAVALLAALALLACKKRRRPSSTHHPAPSAGTGPIAAPSSAASIETVVEPEPEPEPRIDASLVTDRKLCLKTGQQPNAIIEEPPGHIVGAMRAALRSVRSIHAYGVTMMEIPEIKGWGFEVRASREAGLSYEAKSTDEDSISIVQVPSGKTYARGRFLFSAHADLASSSGDQWFEVPEALLTADPGDAHPEGPQGVFGMDIGYKAAIASFVQAAISWYPDRQAEWLLTQSKQRKSSTPASTKEMSTIEKHRYFAGCQSVLIQRRGIDTQLSATGMPLPLQQDPKPGIIAGRFRWGRYNERLRQQKPPPEAVTLASLVASQRTR
jgi:hypothetical protein